MLPPPKNLDFKISRTKEQFFNSEPEEEDASLIATGEWDDDPIFKNDSNLEIENK